MVTEVVLDVDTGTDDAIAIMLAALCPQISLVACTTVGGNVHVEACTDNTLRVLDLIGHGDVPVAQGASRPLIGQYGPLPEGREVDRNIHPETLPAPPTQRERVGDHAIDLLLSTFDGKADERVLVAVGPLTNLAGALLLRPEFARYVGKLIIMGGGHAVSNITPSAEFNIWKDPEAARVVFRAGFKDVTLVTLDATHQALISRSDCGVLRDRGGKAGALAADVIEQRIAAYDDSQPMAEAGSAPVHDALCIAALVAPEVLSTHVRHVDVETQGELTRGRTVVDMQRRGVGQGEVNVAMGADRALFRSILIDALSADVNTASASWPNTD